MTVRGLVEGTHAAEPELGGLARALVVEHVVPFARHGRQRGVGIAGPSKEVDVVHGVGLAHERAAGREVRRSRAVQQQADLELMVALVVAEAVAQRLDRVADRMRVPEVDEELHRGKVLLCRRKRRRPGRSRRCTRANRS